MTADVKFTDNQFSFKGATFKYSYDPTTKQYKMFADQLVFPRTPQRVLHYLRLFIGEHVKKGTHIIGDGNGVTASYIKSGGEIHLAQSGTLVLDEDPSEVGLKGKFDFQAVVGDSIITVTNGIVGYVESLPK